MRVLIFISSLLWSASLAVAEPFSADKAMEQITSIVAKSGLRPKVESLGCREAQVPEAERECLYVDYGDISFELKSGPHSEFRAAIVEGPKLLDNHGGYLGAVMEVIDPTLLPDERKKYVDRVLKQYSERPTDPVYISVSSPVFRHTVIILNPHTARLIIARPTKK